jgi:hypothetical protein
MQQKDNCGYDAILDDDKINGILFYTYTLNRMRRRKWQ